MTGTAFPLVKANWLKDGEIEHLREDRNTAITDKGGGVGALLVMFDVIYPTAPGVHLNGGPSDAMTLTESRYQSDSTELRVAEKAAVRI